MNKQGLYRIFCQLWLPVIVIVIAIMSPVLFPLIAPTPLRFTNQPFPISEQTVHTGDSLTITVARCNDTWFTVTYTAEWQLVRTDGLHVLLPLDGQMKMPGCSTYVESVNLIPSGTPPGTYHIVGIASVPTPWETYNVPFVTDRFDIVP